MPHVRADRSSIQELPAGEGNTGVPKWVLLAVQAANVRSGRCGDALGSNWKRLHQHVAGTERQNDAVVWKSEWR